MIHFTVALRVSLASFSRNLTTLSVTRLLWPFLVGPGKNDSHSLGKR